MSAATGRAAARSALAVVIAAVVPACGVEIGGADPANGAPLAAGAVESLAFRCPAAPPRLTLRDLGALPLAPARLLAARSDLLLVAEAGGVHRLAAGRVETLVEGVRDADLRGDTLWALGTDRVDVLTLPRGGRPRPVRSLPARTQDVGIAAVGRTLWLHSPADPDGALLLARDAVAGAVRARFLTVERDLLRMILGGGKGFLEDMGLLRGGPGRVVLAPLVRDPLHVVDGAGRRTVALALADGARGRLDVERVAVERPPRCPTCPREVAVEDRLDLDALWADALVTREAVWGLRLDPPGSARGLLLRIDLDREPVGEVRAWRVEATETPRAMALWRGALVVAGTRRLAAVQPPDAATGARCPRKR